MRFKIMTVVAAVMLMGSFGFAGEHGGKEHGGSNPSDKPASAKDVNEIKRQIRLMRAEMAELEEKIAEMTGDRDGMYATEDVTGDSVEESRDQ